MSRKIVRPPRLNQEFCFLLGLFLRSINKCRHEALGYRTPRTFPPGEIKKSVSYVLSVTKKWADTLNQYSGESNVFKDKDVLELGPGPDLGTGLVLLALGAQSYTAFDRFPLIRKTPDLYYEILLERLLEYPCFEKAEKALRDFRDKGHSNRFLYVVDRSYNIRQSLKGGYALVVSQAVLEHIDDPRRVVGAVYNKMKPDGIFLASVDAGTHTGILRDVDPLNLYRYSDRLWQLLKFKGSPNRVLPSQYGEIFRRAGFIDLSVLQRAIYDIDYVKRAKSFLAEPFKSATEKDLETQTFVCLARRGRTGCSFHPPAEGKHCKDFQESCCIRPPE